MADEVRQKFEAWAKLHGDSCSRIRCCSEHTFRHERYDSVFTEWEWRSWQEAYSEGKRAGEIARWIPVAEKLPEPQQFVLAYYAEDDMEVTWHTGDFWSTDYPGEPTHWQPLPAAPEEKKSTGESAEKQA